MPAPSEPTTTETPEPRAPESTSSPGPIRRWLPTLLAQVVSVIFAVLVALAVDEWWEERENLRFAEQTVEAIAREIQENRSELETGTASDPDSTVAALGAAIEGLREGREPESIDVLWDVALLSSAAWETAQVTEATRYMDLDDVIRLAQLYELQRFYARGQDELTSLIGTVAARMETAPVPVLLELQARLASAHAQRDVLATVYACTLVRLEGPDAVEPGACPEGHRTDRR